MGVHLYQPKNLDEQAASILEEQGVAQVSFTTNPAYQEAQKELASEQAMPFYAPILLVLVCGYLMIYSIVHVAVQKDTLYYAGLKALGMTPRQICRLLLEKGFAVSFLSFLPGWMLGFGLHFFITRRVIAGMEENPALYFLSWTPFAFAALCTLLTTLFACLIPTIRLSRMTPVQTADFATGRLPRHRHRPDGHMTLAGMALRTTFAWNRWRTVWSALSLLLAMVLLSSVWIQYVSFREDIYLSVTSPWDYHLTDGSA